MQLGEKSAFFIPKDNQRIGNLCRSPLLTDICFCNRVFQSNYLKSVGKCFGESLCICEKNLVFVATLLRIGENGCLSGICSFPHHDTSYMYLMRQIDIAKKYSSKGYLTQARYVFQYVLCHILGLSKNMINFSPALQDHLTHIRFEFQSEYDKFKDKVG